MQKKTVIALSVAALATAAVAHTALATKNYNSSISNARTSIGPGKNVTYSSELRITVDGPKLTRNELQRLVNQVCAQATKDIVRKAR